MNRRDMRLSISRRHDQPPSVEWTALGRTSSIPMVLLGQLSCQYFFLSVLFLLTDWQYAEVIPLAYLFVLSLEATRRLLLPSHPFRFLSSLATCNTVLLFYTAGSSGIDVIFVPLLLAWLSRYYVKGRDGRPLVNAGTFGIFIAGLVSSYGHLVLPAVRGDGPPLMPISHWFTTVPHFVFVVGVLGTAMALLGDHLLIVVPLVVTFTLVSRTPNASELLIFLFAAPDPAVAPRSRSLRVMGGVLGGLLSGLLWQIIPFPNELLKVAGLLLATVILRASQGYLTAPGGPRPALAERVDAATASLSTRRAKRWLSAVFLVFLAAVDAAHGYEQVQVWAQLVDASTNEAMDHSVFERVLTEPLVATVAGTEYELSWSNLFHHWESHRRGGTPPRRGSVEGAHVDVSFRLRCETAPRRSPDPVIRETKIVPSPSHSVLHPADSYFVVLTVDVAAAERACAAGRAPGSSQ